MDFSYKIAGNEIETQHIAFAKFYGHITNLQAGSDGYIVYRHSNRKLIRSELLPASGPSSLDTSV